MTGKDIRSKNNCPGSNPHERGFQKFFKGKKEASKSHLLGQYGQYIDMLDPGGSLMVGSVNYIQ